MAPKKKRARTHSIRVLTLNIQGLGARWFSHREKEAIRAIRLLRPDILCLQEVTLRLGAVTYEQGLALGRPAGLSNMAFAPYGNPIEVLSRDQGGIAVISRWPMSLVRNRRLPPAHETPPDGRVVLFVGIEHPAGRIHVANTHLSWRPEESSMRLVQVGLILDDLLRAGWLGRGAPTLLTGDFNATEGEPAVQLAREHLCDTWRLANPHEPGHTWVAANPWVGAFSRMPDRRIDYIFASDAFEVGKSLVVLDGSRSPCVSDHFGILTELETPS